MSMAWNSTSAFNVPECLPGHCRMWQPLINPSRCPAMQPHLPTAIFLRRISAKRA